MDDTLKIVIVGMVDHGKSTFTGRLLYDTGSLPDAKLEEIKKASQELGKEIEFAFLIDHLQEEREQEMTIDTAQIFFRTNKRRYVIIDAPGHVEFIKNMITGAAQADAAVLIVDASRGVEVQTKRHAVILGMLGIKDVIVVINKMDLEHYNKQKFEKIKKDVLQFLSGISIVPMHVIPISAKKGDFVAEYTETMPWYEGPSVLDALDMIEKQKDDEEKPLAYPVQDIYYFGERLLAGRVESGKIAQGDEIVVLPQNKKTSISAIKVFEGEKKEAKAGECITVTLKDLFQIERGNIIAHEAERPFVTNTFHATLFWMTGSFKKGDQLILRCSTQEMPCKIDNIAARYESSTMEVLQQDAEELKETEVGEVLIQTDTPLCVTHFTDIPELGRFVIVKNNEVVAGGIVTKAF
ncbi:MAG: GTP-binding protein [Candidatus Woesearchaeota archaeon]